MTIIYSLPPFSSRWVETLFDAALQMAMLSPILFYFMFRPMLSNIKERREAEEQVVKLNNELGRRIRELEELNRELETFSYSVSHDLRSPLLGIQGFSQLLVEDYSKALDSRGIDFLQRIISSGKRMSQIIDSLLVLSGVAAAEIRCEQVNLSEMARKIAAELALRNPESHMDIKIEDGILVSGDPRLIRIVMDNLMGNAWKYTSKHPNPCIEFGELKEPEKEKRKVYYIRDNGVGFDMVDAAKLFIPFERLHSGAEYPGTGVGLATVKRIIHRHGGRIWAESEVGMGAVFYFGLPNEGN